MFASLVCVFLRLTRKQAFLRKIKESLGLQLAMPQLAKTVWAWVCWTLLATQTRKHSLKACAHCPVLHDPEECPLDAVFRWGRDTFKWPFSHLPFGLYMFDIKMVAKKGKRDMYLANSGRSPTIETAPLSRAKKGPVLDEYKQNRTQAPSPREHPVWFHLLAPFLLTLLNIKACTEQCRGPGWGAEWANEEGPWRQKLSNFPDDEWSYKDP